VVEPGAATGSDALRGEAISVNSCAVKLPQWIGRQAIDAAGDEADSRAFERWTRLDRLPAREAGSVVDLWSESEVRRDPLRDANRSDADARAAVLGEPARPARWVLSSEAERRLRALAKAGNCVPFLLAELEPRANVRLQQYEPSRVHWPRRGRIRYCRT
jgi:hypothetical protein